MGLDTFPKITKDFSKVFCRNICCSVLEKEAK